MHKIEEVSDRRRHDSFIWNHDKESCHYLSESPPLLCIKHVSKKWSEADSLV